MELRAEDLTLGSTASNSSALHLFVFPDDSQISEDHHGYGILLKEVKRTIIRGHPNGEMTCRPSMKVETNPQGRGRHKTTVVPSAPVADHPVHG